MDFDWIWKAALIVVAGTILLRIAGRKSISQMTLPETVITIGMGTLLIQPIASKNIWLTFAIGVILIGTLLVMEYFEIKSDFFENLISGKAKILIEKGTVNEGNLKKVRLTTDQLEANLRQKNVAKISDVEFATLEPNGKIGLMLKQEAQPVTKKEFQKLMEMIEQTMQVNNNVIKLSEQMNQMNTVMENKQHQNNIFTEVEDNGHEKPVPKHLQ